MDALSAKPSDATCTVSPSVTSDPVSVANLAADPSTHAAPLQPSASAHVPAPPFHTLAPAP